MLKYDQFVFESASNMTFGQMYDFALVSYKDKVKEMVHLTLKEIVKNFNIIKIDYSDFVILDIETEDKFSIAVSFNSTFRKIGFFIIDKILNKTVYDTDQFAKIETFAKDLEKVMIYLRSNEYKSKRGIEKFNL